MIQTSDMSTEYPLIGLSPGWNMQMLLNSSLGSMDKTCGMSAVHTTVELWRTKIVLLGSGGPTKTTQQQMLFFIINRKK